MKQLYRELGKFAEDTGKLGHKQLQKYIKENEPLIRKRIEELVKKLEQSGYKERAERWKEFLEREFGLKD